MTEETAEEPEDNPPLPEAELRRHIADTQIKVTITQSVLLALLARLAERDRAFFDRVRLDIASLSINPDIATMDTEEGRGMYSLTLDKFLDALNDIAPPVE